MKKLLRVKEEVRTGIHPSEDYADKHFWEDGANVFSSERAVRPISGQFPFVSQIENIPVRGMIEVSHAPTPDDDADPEEIKSLFWASENSIFLFQENIGIEDVTPAGGFPGTITLQRQDLWDFTENAGVVLVVIDAGSVNNRMIYAYDLRDSGGSGVGSGLKFQEFASHPSMVTDIPVGSARIARQLNQFTLLINCKLSGEYGKESQLVVWSDVGNIWDWNPTTANLAGSLRVTEMNGPIIAAEPIGNSMGLYGQNEMFILSYVGPPFVFGVNRALNGIGALSKNAVVSIGRNAYGMGPKGIWVTDGFTFKYVDRPDMYNYIYSDINLDMSELIFAWENAYERLIVFFFPSENSTENDRAVAYNYIENTWWPMAYNRTAGISGKVFDQAILGDANGTIYQQSQPIDPGSLGTGVQIPGAIGQPIQYKSSTRNIVRFGQFGFGQGKIR